MKIVVAVLLCNFMIIAGTFGTYAPLIYVLSLCSKCSIFQNFLLYADSRSSSIESKIIGGSRVFPDKHNYSFVVSVVIVVEQGEFSSGGSLISIKHVLTVAHSIYSIKKDRKYDFKGVCVVVGSTTLNPRDGTVYTAVHIDIHVGYIPNKDPIHADIALLTVNMNRYIKFKYDLSKLPSSIHNFKINF